MAAGDVWAALIRVLQLLLEGYRGYHRKTRTDAVRAGPLNEWLHKLGGTDKRPSSGSDDAGGDRH